MSVGWTAVKKLAQFFLDRFPKAAILFGTVAGTSGITPSKNNMIEARKILEVIRLLRERKHSQRIIARMMGISRGTVSAIARGKIRRDFTEPLGIEPKGPWVRCPQCGGKTQMPCTVCHLKKTIKIRRKNSAWSHPVPRTGLLDVELKGWQLRRYLQVRKWREEQLDPNFDVIPESWPWKSREQ